MQMRWYNPSLRGFEWRNRPEDDKEALTILDESVTSRSYVERILEVAQSGGDRHGVAYPGG